MAQDRLISDLDAQVVNSLQVFPRVSWSQLGATLGYDATTLARRWAKLREAGLVWTLCYQEPKHLTAPRPALALVEVDVRAGERESVVSAVVQLREVVEVLRTTGSRDLLITVVHESLTEADAFIAASISSLPGVRATRTRFTETLFKDGSKSRLGVLDLDTVASLSRAAEGFAGEPSDPTPVLVRVMGSLLSDVRRPAPEIAAELGLSTTTVTRAIHRLFGSPWFVAKADFVHQHFGYSAAASLWFRVPSHELAVVGMKLAAVPGVRMSAAVLDRMNLAVTVWLRRPQDLQSLLQQIEKAHPQIELCEAYLIPSVAKRTGAVLTDSGHLSHVAPTPLAVAPTDAASHPT